MSASSHEPSPDASPGAGSPAPAPSAHVLSSIHRRTEALLGRVAASLEGPDAAALLPAFLDELRGLRAETAVPTPSAAPTPPAIPTPPIPTNPNGGGRRRGRGSAARRASVRPAGDSEETRTALRHARCILWAAEIVERDSILCWSGGLFDESTAQLVLPLDVPAGKSYTQVWYERRHPDDRRTTEESTDRIIRSGQTAYTQEFRCVNRHGVEQWLYEDVSIRPAGPGRWSAFGVCTDVTPLKRTEAALRNSEEKLHLALEASGAGVWEWNEEIERILWTRNCDVLHGIPAGTFDGSYDSFLAAVHPDDRERVDQASVDIIERKLTDYHSEYRVQRPDLGTRWIETRGKLLYDDSGRLLRINGVFIDITDRKRSETALRESEEQFRQLAENIRDIAWLYDYTRSEMLYVGPPYEQVWGRTRESLYADPDSWFELVHPDDRDSVEQAVRERLTHGDYDEIYRIVRPDGAVRWIRERSFPIADDSGEVFRVAGITEDFTDRKEAEDRRREESHILETLHGVGSSLTAELDLRRLVQAITDAGTELSGAQFGAFFYHLPSDPGDAYTLYSLSGAPMDAFATFPMPRHTDLFGPTFRGEATLRIDDVTQDPRYGNNPPFHGMPEGHLPVKSYLSLPVLARSGERLGGLFFGHPDPGVFTDRHQRILEGLAAQAAVALDNALLYQKARETEARLRDERNLLRTLIDHLPDFIFVKDAEHRFRVANHALVRACGRSHPEELVNLTDLDLLPPDRAAIYHAEEDEVLRTGRPLIDREDLYRDPDGLPIWYSITKIPLRDAQGAIVGLIGITRDITGHRRAALDLQETNRRLEEALAELKKTQQQIIEQERLRAMGQMASGIAHDFNNALTPIAGLSELLLIRPEQRADPERVRRYLHLIHTAAHDAAEVVSRLREFYRFRDSNERYRPVLLNPLIEQSIELTRPIWKDQANAAGIVIEVATDLDPVPAVGGNESGLRDLLANLIFNAVDAMPRGGALTVRTRAGDDGVLLQLSDTGIGMDAETRRRCLEPFFTTKGPRGSGLGLSMVQGIVTRHGGSLDIESAPGRGTTFSIRFPPSDGRISEPFAEDEPIEQDRPAASRPLRVLVADDEPLIRDVVSEFLAGEGHSVVLAASGADALERFRSDRFDLVITDKSMPGMTGDQLARRIKEIDPSVPVLLITGFGEFMRSADEHPPGVDLVLSKPITWAALARAIAQLTSGLPGP